MDCAQHCFCRKVDRRQSKNTIWKMVKEIIIYTLTNLDSLHFKLDISVVESTIELSVPINIVNSSHVVSNQREDLLTDFFRVVAHLL